MAPYTPRRALALHVFQPPTRTIPFLVFRVLSIPPAPLSKGELAFCVAGLLRTGRLSGVSRCDVHATQLTAELVSRCARGVPPLTGGRRSLRVALRSGGPTGSTRNGRHEAPRGSRPRGGFRRRPPRPWRPPDDVFLFDLEPLFGRSWGPPHEPTAGAHRV